MKSNFTVSLYDGFQPGGWTPRPPAISSGNGPLTVATCGVAISPMSMGFRGPGSLCQPPRVAASLTVTVGMGGLAMSPVSMGFRGPGSLCQPPRVAASLTVTVGTGGLAMSPVSMGFRGPAGPVRAIRDASSSPMRTPAGLAMESQPGGRERVSSNPGKPGNWSLRRIVGPVGTGVPMTASSISPRKWTGAPSPPILGNGPLTVGPVERGGHAMRSLSIGFRGPAGPTPAPRDASSLIPAAGDASSLPVRTGVQLTGFLSPANLGGRVIEVILVSEFFCV